MHRSYLLLFAAIAACSRTPPEPRPATKARPLSEARKAHLANRNGWYVDGEHGTCTWVDPSAGVERCCRGACKVGEPSCPEPPAAVDGGCCEENAGRHCTIGDPW